MTATIVPGFPPEHAAVLGRAVTLAADTRPANAEDLANLLYARWYAAPTGPPQHVDPTWPPMAGLLREGHDATLAWQPAVVIRVGAGGVVVVRDASGSPRALIRGAYTHEAGSAAAGLAPQVGEHLRVIARSGAVVTEGWWRTWGGGWDPRSAPGGVTRVYLSPDVNRLPSLAGAVTALLEHMGSPWMVKAGVSAATLDRPDGFVIYFRDADADALLDPIARRTVGLVRRLPGPPMTSSVADGVAWAQDPGDGRSFGEHRCALVAAALVPADPMADPLDAIARAFAAAGVDPGAPHLRGTGTGVTVP